MLEERHLQSLAKRGIDQYDAEMAGVRSVDHKESVDLMRPSYDVGHEDWSGIFIPYFDPVKQELTDFGRVRFDTPITRGNRSVKYMQRSTPEGSPPAVFYNGLLSAMDRDKFKQELNNPSVPLFIVEGEFKALSLASRIGWSGVVLGLGGVENWSKKRQGYAKTRVLAPGFDRLTIKDREVFICFDSDVLTNRNVSRAERELAWALKYQKRPKSVRLVTTPTGDSGEKLGLDDYLVQFGLDWEEKWQDMLDGAAYKRVPVPEVIDMVSFNQREVKKAEIYCGTEKVAFIVNGAVCFIHASSGVGKSYFTLQLANDMATGRKFLGLDMFDVPKPRKVLMLQAEMPDAWWQPRTRQLERVMNGDISNNLMLVNDRFTLSECDRWGNFVSHFEILEAMVKQHRPEVIIMDPLSGFYDLSESNNDQNRKFMERLTWIAIRYGIAIIMVHHDRKDQTGNPMHTMRGATAFTDWATSVWGLRQSMDEDEKGRETIVSKTDIDFLIEKCRLANGPRPDKIRMTRIEGSSFFTPIIDAKLF
jgi:hypothetical protein